MKFFNTHQFLVLRSGWIGVVVRCDQLLSAAISEIGLSLDVLFERAFAKIRNTNTRMMMVCNCFKRVIGAQLLVFLEGTVYCCVELAVDLPSMWFEKQQEGMGKYMLFKCRVLINL